MNKFNFVDANEKYHPPPHHPASIFTKLTNVQQQYAGIICTEFLPNWLRNMEGAVRN